MAYIKQNWENTPNKTTPISASRLNHMEDGIGNALTEHQQLKTINNLSLIGTGNINIQGGGEGGTSNHDELNNLEYENSGHIGFAGTDTSNTFTRSQTIISNNLDGIRLEDEEDSYKYANFGTSGFQYKSGTGQQSVNIPYEDIATKEDAKGIILWENLNPFSEMSSGTTINLSTSNYDYLEVIFIDNVLSTTPGCHNDKVLKGYNIRLGSIVQNTMTYRVIKRINDTTYEVESGYNGVDVQERRCVPIKIIGFKN